ncbi:MAG: hypothetical protein ACT4OY_00840 [Alphaproteobacteria bacterium]
MGQHAPVEADQDTVNRAEKTWHNFVKTGKWGILHVIVIMGILLLVYLRAKTH